MAQYDAFADFYNRDWGEDYHQQLSAILHKLLLANLAPGDSILDVGCGTGTVAAWLTERGFAVTGIDQSKAMLEFARRNAPGAEFIRADARSFDLDRTFTASIATFEAMNHVLDESELAGSFRCIARATERCFVFDMTRETAYDLFWNGEHTVVQDGITCRMQSSYDPISRIATCRTEVGAKLDEITERYYDAVHVERMLKDAGFTSVRRFDGKRDLGMYSNVAIGRFFYQCFR